jgi:hypothetical protein
MVARTFAFASALRAFAAVTPPGSASNLLAAFFIEAYESLFCAA